MRMKNNGICDYLGFEKVNPYEYKRKLNSKDISDRLQIARDNTARRTEVERNEEQQFKTDSNCFNKMLLCAERTRGYNIYKSRLK